MQADPTELSHEELEEALDAGRLVVAYQPCYDLRTGELVALEALARLRERDGTGLLPPDLFLGGAERNGLISRIDDLVMHQALTDLARWRSTAAGAHLCVSVNIAVADLGDPLLPSRVREAAATTGVPTDALIIELTETMLSSVGRGHEQMLAELSALGCNVTLDDFGTGNASLAYLQRFDVQGIKIDRSFVHLLGSGGSSERVVESLVRFCLSLGVHLVAEGIENLRQVEALRQLGCPFGQGFLMSHPLTAAEVDALVQESPHAVAPVLLGQPSTPPAAEAGEEPETPARRRRHARASRVIAALVALVIVGLAALALSGQHRGEQKLEQAAQSRLVAVDELAAGRVDSQLAGLRDLVATFSHSDSVRQALESRGPDRMATVMAALRSSTTGIYSTSLYDGAGNLLAVDPYAPDVVGKNFAYRDWYLGANSTTGAYLSEAFQLVTPSAPWALAVSARVLGPSDRTVGYVVATFVIAELQQQLQTVLHRHGVSAVLVDARGKVLASPDPAELGTATHDPRLTVATAGEGPPDRRRQWAVRPIGAVNGWLLAEQSRDASTEIGSGATARLVLLLALAAAAVVLIALWLRTDVRRRRLESDLVEAHEWAMTVMTEAPTPLALCDAAGRIEMANPAFAELVGCDLGALRGQALTSWVPPSDLLPPAEGVTRATVTSAGGGVRAVESRARLLRDRRGRELVLHAIADVTPHQEEKERLRAQGRLDPLTGVGNRVVVYEALAAAVGGGGHSALLMVDLDGFKAVNDTLGHAVGDDVLRAVAAAMHGALPAHDVVARVGGDEFVALVRLPAEGGSGELADQLHRRLQQVIDQHPASRAVAVGVSVGVALVGTDGVDAEELLRIADLRMYEAKRAAASRTARRRPV